jgi:hypothetical protein
MVSLVTMSSQQEPPAGDALPFFPIPLPVECAARQPSSRYCNETPEAIDLERTKVSFGLGGSSLGPSGLIALVVTGLWGT